MSTKSVRVDNLTVGTLHILNEVAHQHGLLPYQFVATVGYHDEDVWSIKFEPPDPGAKMAFGRMMKALGVQEGALDISGTEAEVWDRLMLARSRGRSR